MLREPTPCSSRRPEASVGGKQSVAVGMCVCLAKISIKNTKAAQVVVPGSIGRPELLSRKFS